MKELKEFTVERLERMHKSLKEGLKLGFADALILQDVVKIALAAKQAEPDYYIHGVEVCDSYGPDIELRAFNNSLDASKCKDDHGGEIIPVYTTPPLNHTEQHMVVPDGWIKCSERMPECSKWDHAAVIASEGSNSFVAYYNKHECKFLDEPFGESLGNKITHWMPLPSPPVAAPKPESE